MDSHKEALLKDAKEVTHILTIGWRGTEEHFHKDITVTIQKPVKVLNVNVGDPEIENNLKKYLNCKVAEMKTFPSGFSKFIESENLLTEFLS